MRRGVATAQLAYRLQAAQQTNRDSFPGRSKRFTSANRRDRLPDQRSLLFGWYLGFVLGVRLIAHLRLVPRLSMRGAVPCKRAVLRGWIQNFPD
jgi:hypothetical protein